MISNISYVIAIYNLTSPTEFCMTNFINDNSLTAHNDIIANNISVIISDRTYFCYGVVHYGSQINIVQLFVLESGSLASFEAFTGV